MPDLPLGRYYKLNTLLHNSIFFVRTLRPTRNQVKGFLVSLCRMYRVYRDLRSSNSTHYLSLLSAPDSRCACWYNICSRLVLFSWHSSWRNSWNAVRELTIGLSVHNNGCTSGAVACAALRENIVKSLSSNSRGLGSESCWGGGESASSGEESGNDKELHG